MRTIFMTAFAAAAVLGLSGCPHVNSHPPSHSPSLPHDVQLPHDTQIPPLEDIRPHEPPTPPVNELPPIGALGPAAEQEVHDAHLDQVKKELICFAYDNFYNPSTGEFFLPSEAQFLVAVIEKLRPRTEQEQLEAKVEGAYRLFGSVTNGELQAVAVQLACD